MNLETDSVSDDRDSAKREQVPRQRNVSLTSIPQIILTEPTQGDALPMEVTSSSPYSLSPPSPRKANPSTPLPLTKDLLQRKNKLDHLLQQEERQPSQEYSSLHHHYVDERVTAGLGISTPAAASQNNKNKTNSNLGSDLRSHNSLYTRGSTQIRSDTDKTLAQTDTHISNDSQWSNDLDIYRVSMTDSNSRHKYRRRSVTTASVSGSSNRNSASMRPYSVNHKHTHHNRRHHTADYQRPIENRHHTRKHHRNYFIDAIYSAVNRVIFTRAPESKEMAASEHFDFGTNKDQTATTKSVSPKLGEKDDTNIHHQHNNKPSTIPPISTTSPVIINSISSPPLSRHNRYSWLSTQDGKSDHDHLSIIDKNFSIQSSLQLKEEQKRYYYNPNYQPVDDKKVMPNPLQGHSLFILGPENPLRIAAWKCIRLRSIETILFFLMVLHWFLLAVIPIKENRDKTVFGAQWTHYPILLIQVCYTIEAISKIIAYGFILSPTLTRNHVYKSIIHPFTYFQSPMSPTMQDVENKTPNHKAFMCSFGNFIDLVSIVSYWIDLFMMMNGYPYISLFKSLGAMRPIRLLSLLPGTAVIISNFEYAYETRTRFTSITKADLRIFKNAWAEVDPRGTGYIQKDYLGKFLRLLDGRFKFRIYEDEHELHHLLELSKIGTAQQVVVNPSTSPAMEEKSAYSSGFPIEYNYTQVNRSLSTMNVDVTRQRRFEYNICVKEILRTETSKGLPFASVLTVLSYRFINISESLRLDPLIQRLEKMDQITQEYHLEKAAGFFLAQVQRRRYIKALWKKRDEEEVLRLGITNTSGFNFVPSSPESNNRFILKNNKKKRPPPVPSIVINNAAEEPSPLSAGPLSSPLTPLTYHHHQYPSSPMSPNSTEVQYDISHSVSDASSPTIEIDHLNRTNTTHSTGGLSPMSPLPLATSFGSPRHQTWLLMDGNSEMPNDVSDGLMDSLSKSVWSDMLRHEEDKDE
ncbi:hypothetical protein K501DRAFT_329474 [Backusella circina FSU 941]|nr:hypothetical protein K501DRAFT_329474 [Backusella circina FSU 941]